MEDISRTFISFGVLLLLDEKLDFSSVRQHGEFVLWLSTAEVDATALIVPIVLILAGVR
ncbi:MAG: hypothetical protein JRF50_06925 [Deltaproteobacteria bacterium]|nr:hypothetical protein [Deltaproteobacteria bacterium]